MQQILSATSRRLVAAACMGAVLATSGCSWFRRDSGYEQSPQTRPLEIPPDLDAPVADPAMAIPAVDASAGARAGAGTTPTGTSFVVQDTVASTWRRLGLALDRIEGAVIDDRAELLAVYTVRYQGESFLLRVQQADGGSRIDAVQPDGTPMSSAAAGALLGSLRQRLG